MKKIIKTPLVLAMSAGLISSFTMTTSQAGNVETDNNIFAITELSSAYMQTINKDDEGKCGEGKCGEGTCGDKKPS